MPSLQFILILLFFIIYDIELLFFFPISTSFPAYDIFDILLITLFFIFFVFILFIDFKKHLLFWQY